MTLIIDYAKTLIPVNWKHSPNGWVSGNCPMCVVNGESRPDTKSRGGFHFEEEKFQYNCFNCGYSTGWSAGKKLSHRLKKLLLRLGADESDVQRLTLELMREDELASILYKQNKRDTPVVIDWPEMQLPEGTMPFMDHPEIGNPWIEAAEYISERGFNVEDHRFQFTNEKIPARMNKRVILPFYYNKRVVGYTGRWVGSPPDGMPKYYNKQPPKNFVYGLDRQTADKRVVIVTEGILDAIVTDGVAIGSNNINDDQANIIDSLNKRVILLPDADSAGAKFVDTAIERGWGVAFPEWSNCKDAGDAMETYGRLFTVKSILDSTIANPTKIKVMTQRYCK
ncbi:hypothetical protein N8072_00895 [bacterium]|nr:hypothetical protein [bacterium]MDB4128748.1 hypothetical protein [bacterium]MDC1257217.1 hypothetical protein [bacterium]